LLEEEHLDAEGRAKIARRPDAPKKAEIQLTLFTPTDHPLLEELRRLDLDNATPLEVVRQIKRWQEELANEEKRP